MTRISKIHNSEISYNTSKNGAGIYSVGTSSSDTNIIYLKNTKIQNNKATENGAGIYSQVEECLSEGTQIKMQDGSLKNIEDIRLGDFVKSFNHETGQYVDNEVYYIYKSDIKDNPIRLTFESGNTLDIVGCHDLFNKEEMKYITISEANYRNYIGKCFYNVNISNFDKLLSVQVLDKTVKYYSIYVARNFNCIANGFLTIPNDCEQTLNIFKFDDDLKVNQAQLQADIEKYGLFTLEESELLDEEEFEMFNMKYLNLMIGKGLVTREQLINSLKEIYSANSMMPLSGSSPTEGYSRGSIVLDDNSIIKNNAVSGQNNNLYLSGSVMAYVTDSAGIDVGVTLASGTGVFSSDVYSNNVGFFSDNSIYLIKKTGTSPSYTYSLVNGYTASKAATTNGSFSLSASGYSANNTNGSLFVPEGTTVTITPKSNTGYKVDTITVKDADSNKVTVTNNKFTMPAKDVTVTVTFKLGKLTPTVPDFAYNSATGVLSPAKGKDLGTVITYYKVGNTWTTTKPTTPGTYSVGVVTTGSSTYYAIGTASNPFTSNEWTYTVAGNEHTHTFATTWSKDATYHWHAATCEHTTEVSGKAVHTYGSWFSNNDATTSADGTKSRICSVCGYKQTTKDAGSKKDGGEATNPEDKQNENSTTDEISNSEVEKENATGDDKTENSNGEDIRVWVEVEDISSTISSEDKALIQEGLPENHTVGMYLDISLWKQITGSDATKISGTSDGNVKVEFEIPEEIQKAGRTYKLIQIYNGVATIINPEVDTEFNVSFETNLFTTYALIYEEKSNASSNDIIKENGNIDVTNVKDTNNVWIWLFIIAALAIIGLIIIFLKNRQEEKDEP